MAVYNTYSAEQQEYLRENCKSMTRKELTEGFNSRFGTKKSVLAIKGYCNNRGWNGNSDGRYQKGNCSWQTGLNKDEFRSHYSEETFKKMIAPAVEANKKWRIGDETIRHGTPMIVTSEDYTLSFEQRLTAKRRYVWEQAHGSIPAGHRIIHLDGNTMNCELCNLYCIPNKFVPLLNKNHWLTNNRDHTLTAIKWCELFYALKIAQQELSRKDKEP